MENLSKKVHNLLLKLYDLAQVEDLESDLWRQIEAFRQQNPQLRKNISPSDPFTEKDIFLITYADQFLQWERSPLEALAMFLGAYVKDVISGLHILPFFPYSSDDGFAVIDYRRVSRDFGTWKDIDSLAGQYRLIVDLVANHVSSESRWFQGFLRHEKPYTDFFISLEPGLDLSAVARPRATPLLSRVETDEGPRYVWTTFGPDQIDLNYNHPGVLLEIIKVLLFYVSHGARVIRLDAIAYLWKLQGTSCIHLPQTHVIVKILRAVLDACAPSVLLLTETNVPHQENISYFGDRVPGTDRTDEAQMVYQFSLAPLLLHTFISGDVTRLNAWLHGLPKQPPGTTFMNFTATHDGIGIRPAQGLLEPDEIRALVERALSHGGLISYGSNPDGSQSPYELNITWYDALNDPVHPDMETDIRRFLASQAILLALSGVPGIYVHSLFGSRNCTKCLDQTGRARSLNREKLFLEDLQKELANPQSLKARVLSSYRHLLQVRRNEPAFRPSAAQQLLNADPAIFAILRTAEDGSRLRCLTNVSQGVRIAEAQALNGEMRKNTRWVDLLTGEVFSADERRNIVLGSYQTRWLKSR
ncbi:MAG: sugar phosphorylase [Hyphomicrobiales bacterium]